MHAYFIVYIHRICLYNYKYAIEKTNIDANRTLILKKIIVIMISYI